MAENTAERFIRVPVPMIVRLRRFLHDYPAVNEIISKERFSDAFLADVLLDSVIEYNGVEPTGAPGGPGYPGLDLNLDWERLVELKPIYTRWIQDLACVRCLESISIPMQFNQLMVSSGNITENMNAQWQNLSVTIQRLNARTMPAIKAHKIKLNALACNGVVLTEFYFPNSGNVRTFNVSY